MSALVYLLDTNLLIALVRNRALGQYIRATYPLFTTTQPPLISVVSKGELRAFARRKNWGPKRRRDIEFLFHQLDSVPIEDGVVDAYEEIDFASSQVSSGAVNMGKNDIWIAATARYRCAVLLTTDRDFDHLHPALLQREYIDPSSALPTTP
jgi:tRNA(fMet)-specific endonuclease VapC